MKAGAKIIVQGTVQGVFFRQFVKEHADNLGLRGFVRNLTNGDLEIVVEGEKDRIERLVNLIKKGAPHSQIRNVQLEERKWTGDMLDFKILRF
jgi:acylphosphatase